MKIATSEDVAKSSAMMTGIVLVSRLTGFVRTWAQAFALGATMLASCYTVANNLPNVLFEIVLGGMLYTAFLPVYISVKKRSGQRGANRYASNLVGIILLLMGLLTLAAFIFAGPLVFTQSAGADSEYFSFDVATSFFRFFCIEVLLYPLSALLSGILNAEKKFFWGQAAPIFNNVVVIASFIVGYFVSETNGMLGFLIYALGNPLGVLVQLILQIPPLRKCGVSLRIHINFHDSALLETLRIGIPSIVITLCAAILASVQSSCSLYTSVSGAAILYYARVWFILPASLFAVPISTAMFTELSSLYSLGDLEQLKKKAISGVRQIQFTMIPFTIYLILFSPFIIAFFAYGNFTQEETSFAQYTLIFMAIGLLFYALVPYLQNVCASMHRLKYYATAYGVATVLASLFCIATVKFGGMLAVVTSSTLFYLAMTVVMLMRLSKMLGKLGIFRILRSALGLLIHSIIGGLLGFCVALLIYTFLGGGEISIVKAALCIVCGGPFALVITYGLAIKTRIPEAVAMAELFNNKLSGKRSKGKHRH